MKFSEWTILKPSGSLVITNMPIAWYLAVININQSFHIVMNFNDLSSGKIKLNQDTKNTPWSLQNAKCPIPIYN